jgi:hypothetical protein
VQVRHLWRQSGLRRRGRARSSRTCAGQSAAVRVLLCGPVLVLAAGAVVAAIARTRRLSFAVGCSTRATAAGAGCSADAAPAVAMSLGAVWQRASGGSRTGPWPQAGVSRFSGRRRSSCVVGCTRGLLDLSRRDWHPLVSHNFQADGSNAGRRDRPDVTARNRCWSDAMVRMSGEVQCATYHNSPRAAVLHASARRLFDLVPHASRSHRSRDTSAPRTRRVRDR